MTTYALDPTGSAAGNLISAEPHTVQTIGTSVPAVLFLAESLFYATGVVISYTDVDGNTATLAAGDDYSFMFEVDNVIANNKVFGAIKINNLGLNGTLSINYQAVGGQWRYVLSQLVDVLENQTYSSRVAYLSLAPMDDVFVSGQTTPVVLNSYKALQAAQAAGPLPLPLKAVILPLPNSRRRYVEGGLVVDGNGTKL